MIDHMPTNSLGGPVLVSVIVPCRNEVRHIRAFLESVLNQDLSGLELEVIVADGMSDDGTPAILDSLIAHYPQVRLIDNPGKIVSTGLNAAIRAARGEIIIRMDVHTTYARDYIRECVRALRETGADNVGGPWVVTGRDYISGAIAVAFQSFFVSGGGKAHSSNYSGPVDTVYLGCWSREAFARFGDFDEELVRNQDDELNLRIRRLRGTVWQSARIRSQYTPRSSLRDLFRQYSQYGYWKVRVIQKHRLPASVRHLVPGAFVATLLGLAALAPFWSLASCLLGAVIAVYAIACLAAAVLACRSGANHRYLPVMPAVFATFHLGYGFGFLRGILDFVIVHKRPGSGFTKLTRSA